MVERTFLFTDLQGSTQAWEQAPTVMNDVLAEHDRLLRESIAGHGGEIISVAGDAFGAAFVDCVAATSAAADAQRALAATAWPDRHRPRVRMGVHRGAAYPRDGNFFGSTPNRAARLMSVAHGGQVVVSDEVASALRDQPLSGIELRSLGIQRLKDVAEPMAVWQLCIDDLQDEFPPLTSVGSATVAVPRARTRFLGREEELATLASWLAEPAVITVVAAGGTGKTRLAFETALACAASFADGVITVELADSEPDEVVERLLEAVLADDPLTRAELAADPVVGLTAHLADRRLLLVVDNCEHVVDSICEVVAALVRSCPGLSVLATSREPLGVDGERVFRLAPLDRDPAVTLFLDRASAAGHPLADDDLAAVAEICAQVEGLPLGVELAAARTGTLTPAQIAERLGSDITILRERRSARPGRHRSLEAAIAWSFELLSEPEQRLLEALSAFDGGADLDAAEAVGSRVAGDGVLELLDALVDRSLVSTELVGREVRFRLPVPIRRYARARLEQGGGAAEIEVAHVDHYLQLARSAVPDIDLDASPRLVEGLRAEHQNFLAAIDRELDAGRTSSAARLAITLHPYWEETGHLAEGADALARVVEAAPTSTSAMAALGTLVPYEAMIGRLASARQRAELLTAGLGVGLPPLIEARTRFALGFVDAAAGEWSATVGLWAQAAEDAVADDSPLARQAAWSAAYAALLADEVDRSAAQLDRACALPPPEQSWFPAMAAVVGATGAIVDGRDRVAELEAALETVDAMGLRFRAVLATAAGALGLFAAGHDESAARWWRRGLTLAREMGHLWACSVLLEPACWTIAPRQPERAACLWGAADRFAAVRGYGTWPLRVAIGTGRREAVAEALGDDYPKALAAGARLPFSEAVDEALRA